MDPKSIFRRSITQAGNCIQHVRPSRLSAATPCSEWDLRTLLNHMVSEVIWVPDILAGKSIDDVGNAYDGDMLHDDLRSSWQQAADRALSAIEEVELDGGVAHVSYGDISMVQYVGEVAGDVLVHTWDVAASMQCCLYFDPEISAAVSTSFLPREAEMMASGLYGERVSVSPDADVQTKLLALFGRKMA